MALFGLDKENHINHSIYFPCNALRVFNVDIRRVKPSEEDIKDKLKCSVKQAIELITKMQELDARQKADNEDLQCRIRIEHKKLDNLVKIEEERQVLLDHVATASEAYATGVAKAEEDAKREYERIMSQAEINQAKYAANAKEIQEACEREISTASFAEDSAHKGKICRLSVEREEGLAKIQGEKYKKIINAVGQSTLLEIATAQPRSRAQMLADLNLKGFMIMDHDAPINLIATADGIIAPAQNKPN